MIPGLAHPTLLGLLLAAASPVAAADDEGALNNDTWLPRSEAAQAQLVRGDALLARARAGGPGAALEQVAAFEAWRSALSASQTGDAALLAPAALEDLWPDPDDTHARRSEGLEEAVLRRLLSSPAELRRAWIERFSPAAAAQLEQAPQDPLHLARVERGFPLTRSAALAALRLADRALETGDADSSLTWLRRARRHLDERASEGKLASAIGRRQVELQQLLPRPTEPAWGSIKELSLVRSLRLESTRHLSPDVRPIPLGRGLAPGACFLADDSLVVQTPRAVVWIDRNAQTHAVGGLVLRIMYKDVFDLEAVQPFAAPSAGGWPLLPASDGQRVCLVVDRGQPGRIWRDLPLPGRGNLLACLHFESDGRPTSLWQLSERGLLRPAQPTLPFGEATGLAGRFEFQPGPVIAAGTLYVQARSLSHPDAEGILRGGELWLLALGVRDGALRWKRLLTRAADLRHRNRGRSEVHTSGMPLGLREGVLVVCTNVGIASAFEVADGRLLWSLRTRRRKPEELGWPGSRAPVMGPGSALLSPFDSDHLYALELLPGADGRLFVTPPTARGGLQDLVGGDPGELIFLGRDGRHHALRSSSADGALRSSLYLAEGERFSGPTLLSRGRLLLASDRGMYLFDRERDFFLLDYCPLPDLGAGVGGAPAARGSVLAVTGRDSLWLLHGQ